MVGHCYFTTGQTCEIRVQCCTGISLLAFSLPSKGLTISYVDNFVQQWGIPQPTGQRSKVDIISGWELEAGRYFSLRLWIHQDLLSKPLRQWLLSDGISKRYNYQWNTVSSVIPTFLSPRLYFSNTNKIVIMPKKSCCSFVHMDFLVTYYCKFHKKYTT